jgi:tripartite-type tricarboxylate transporter receptor subunit TctC
MSSAKSYMSSISRRSLLVAGAGFGFADVFAATPEFPTRTVTLVLPYAPGGSTDIVARYMAQQLSLRWKREVIVDNRAGAGGLIGQAYVASAKADGYTLLFHEAGFSTVSVLRPDAKGAGLTDLTPVALVGTQPYITVMNPKLPVNNLQEFIAYARSRPGKLSYASGGAGSSTNFYGELLKKITGTHIVHIPYRGGGPAVIATVAGEVDIYTGAVPSVTPFIKSGRLKGLAVSSDRRASALPDVPTTKEAGVPSLNTLSWNGILAPAGTPPQLIQWLNAEITAVANMPEVKAQLDTYGLTPFPENASRTAAFIREDIKRWGDLAKTAKITAD